MGEAIDTDAMRWVAVTLRSLGYPKDADRLLALCDEVNRHRIAAAVLDKEKRNGVG